MNSESNTINNYSESEDDTGGSAAQLINLEELHNEAKGGAPVLLKVNPLHLVKAKLQVCVGEVEINVGELLGAKEHQVLTLNSKVEEPVDLILEGHVVARGQLVAVDGHFALRITELPLPLQS